MTATFTTPIIMSGAMVRSLLDGRKTQTRRLPTNQWRNLKKHFDQGERCFVWVRESWQLHSRASDFGKIVYRASERASHTEFHRLVPVDLIGNAQPKPFQEGWKPSIHQPRWASRLTLEVTDVRVQPLQSISEADAQAEGVEPVLTGAGELCGWLNYEHRDPGIGYYSEAINSYCSLWESLHGKGSWDTNPDIVAISFRVHHQNIDALLSDRGLA